MQVQNGDTVQIHYTGTLDDGSVFDSSDGREPLTFKVGSGAIIAGLDRELPGMAVGEKKTVNVACSDAYGPINPSMRQSLPRAQFPDSRDLSVGLRQHMRTPEGETIPVVITKIDEAEVEIDANHPLAGRDLTFAIELVAIGG